MTAMIRKKDGELKMKFERFNRSILDFNSKTHKGSQIPCPVLMEKEGYGEFIRIFFSARDSQNRSNIFYADFDTSLNLLYVHDELVIDLGLPGTFSSDGVICSQVVIKDQIEYMLYVGICEGNERARYRYEHGLASRPLGSNEKFTPLGNILTRSENNPVGVSMPFYVKYDFDPARDPNPNNIKPEEAQGVREFLFFITFLPWKEQEGEGGIKKWEPTYKIEFVELDSNEQDFEMKLKYNYRGHPTQKRPPVTFNYLVEDKYESPESLGRPWVYQDGDHLTMLYCERAESLYRGECWDRGYKLKSVNSSNLNVNWWGYDEENLTDYYMPRHVGDKMQCYPAFLSVPGGDSFIFFNTDFTSPINAVKVIK